MSKKKMVFRCSQCGTSSVRWSGRCPDCGEWDSLREEPEAVRTSSAPSFGRTAVFAPTAAIALSEVEVGNETRLSSGFAELDRVLGGGIVPGAAILLGGDPGVGKSTLLLQVCEKVAVGEATCLYVSGEETAAQLLLRARRLDAVGRGILVLTTSDLDAVLQEIERSRPSLVVLDSVQTLQSAEVSGIAGSVGQVRECGQALVSLAKSLSVPVVLIGHVTKEGILAGPKVLEHLVDTVLYFEGDRHYSHRILRAVKNRFGPTDEVGIFEMEEKGLCGVDDPSKLFVGERIPEPGTVVFPALEGTRAILVEIQALTARAPHGTPARRVTGVDPKRVAMILAVLEQKTSISIWDQDVFVNAVGGVKVDEPACDLAIALAVASCRLGVAMPPETVVAGEVGLTGEVRRVSRMPLRLKEARRLGYPRAIVAKGNMESPESGAVGVEKVAETLGFLNLDLKKSGV